MPRNRVETEDSLIYQGRALIHFYPNSHRYRVSVPALDKWRVPVIGVTTILGVKDKSSALQKWTADMAELYGQIQVAENQKSWMYNDQVLKILRDMKTHYRLVKQQAADVGVVVHDYLHSVLLARQNSWDEPCRPELDERFNSKMRGQVDAAIDAGLEFFSKHKLVPWTMEKPVWSPSNSYIGTDDFIGTLDGELVCLDFKTSKYLYSEVFLQTMAYQTAYKEEFPDCGQFEANWGVQVAKDGKLNAVRRGKEYFENDWRAFLGAKTLYEWDRIESGSKPMVNLGSLDAIPIPNEEEW